MSSENAVHAQPWLQRYPEGVPQQIDMDECETLVEMFEDSCARFAARPAFHNMGKTLSFADMEQQSRYFAAYLQHELGLTRGARVAIMMPNLLQYPIAVFGILRAGCVVVNVNPLYTPRELEHQLNDAAVEAIVILANFAKTLEAVIDQVSLRRMIVTEIGDLLGFPRAAITNFIVRRVKKLVPEVVLPGAVSFAEALSRGGAQRPLETPPLNSGDLAFLQYTGGTTGVAKGAMLTHRNMVANLEQVSSWLGSGIDEGKEIVVTALPLYHIFCLTCNCLAYCKHGGLNVLITNPRDMGGFVKELGKWRFTMISGVNTLFNGLIHEPEFSQVDFSHLKFSVGGGMAVQKAVAEKWLAVTGVDLLEGYGLTEASPVVCMNPVDIGRYSGSIGFPLPSTELRFVDEQGVDVKHGEAGELWVRGPQVMAGYWQRPEATADAITTDGWLKTGDIAQVDDEGLVHIVDRKKDMILVSGFNVFPNEIEDVLALHEAVREVACIGVPDEKSGEAVKVFVVLREGCEASVEDIRGFCKQNLTGYKVPRHVEFMQELPKSNVGKILRRELRPS